MMYKIQVQAKGMKTEVTSLQLFNKSTHSTLEGDTTTMECNPTPDIYLENSWFISMDVVEHAKG